MLFLAVVLVVVVSCYCLGYGSDYGSHTALTVVLLDARTHLTPNPLSYP